MLLLGLLVFPVVVSCLLLDPQRDKTDIAPFRCVTTSIFFILVIGQYRCDVVGHVVEI